MTRSFRWTSWLALAAGAFVTVAVASALRAADPAPLAGSTAPAVTAPQASNWGNVEIVGGGLITGVVFNSSEPDLAWEVVSNGFGAAIVLHLAVAASDGGRTAYAVTFDPGTRSQALHISRDGGQSWQVVGNK